MHASNTNLHSFSDRYVDFSQSMNKALPNQSLRELHPYLYYNVPTETKPPPHYNNFELVTKKKHLKVPYKLEHPYEFHTKIVKDYSGYLASNRMCIEEKNVERTMGMKKRIETFSRQRNYLSVASLGDKNYRSPDQSPDFFKKSFVHSNFYGPIKKHDRRSIKEQLGHVDGIFTKILSNPNMRSTQKIGKK